MARLKSQSKSQPKPWPKSKSKRRPMPQSKSKLPHESAAAAIEAEQVAADGAKIWGYVQQAQYRKAFKHADLTWKKYPTNRFAQYHYAVTLGDCEEWAPLSEQEKNVKKAAKILRALLRRCNGAPARLIAASRNEYYWFSRQPRKQYRLGREQVRKGKYTGNYSIGVGAVTIAIEKHKKRDYGVAYTWASRAKDAFEKYFIESPSYYNAYVWYGQALGLLQDFDGMELAFETAAKLANRPVSYREFVKARDVVFSALMGTR